MFPRPKLMAHKQCGAGLIEVAVALLVLSIGALALGSLQISARRMGYEAIQRGEAAALAVDLLERVRANRAALPAYGNPGLGAGSGAPLSMPGARCGGGRCSPAQRTEWDLWQWQQALDGATTSGGAGGLVRPTGCVTVIGRRVTVEIAWQGYRALPAPEPAPACGAGGYGANDAERQWLRMTSWVGEQ